MLNTTGASAIHVTDTAVSGWSWGDGIGWINMQADRGSVSVNSATGALSDMPGRSTGSWINFSPTTVSGGMPSA